MPNPSEWLLLSDVRQRLADAGVVDRELVRNLVAYVRSGGRASGFQRIHDANTVARANARELIHPRMWRVFERGPASPEVGFECFADWRRGDLTWTRCADDSDLQETWESVLIDRVSFDAWLEREAAGENPQPIEISEIRAWIAMAPTENGKTAWTLFKSAFGSRSGTKAAFEANWKAAFPDRRRGRPRRIELIAP